MCTPQMRRYRWKQSREDLSWGSTSSTITAYTQTHTHTHTQAHTGTHRHTQAHTFLRPCLQVSTFSPTMLACERQEFLQRALVASLTLKTGECSDRCPQTSCDCLQPDTWPVCFSLLP